MDTLTHYQIRVEAHLGPGVAAWFPGLAMRHEANGDTTLSGPVADQAALHGVLMRIRDLGLTLVSVQRSEVSHSQGKELDQERRNS